MYCIELVKEEDGIISIAGCKIGDNAKAFLENMGNYCTGCHPLDENSMYGIIDIDTMLIGNPLCNPDILDVDVYCEITQEKKINWMSMHMGYCHSKKECDTPAEFKDFANKLVDSGHFKVEKLYVNSSKAYEIIGLSNNKCEVDFIWTKKEFSDIVITLGEPIYTEDNVYNYDAAISKATRRLALSRGKKIDQLNSTELADVNSRVDFERICFYEKLWKDKIQESRYAYCEENKFPGEYISSDEWNIIYKNAGMSERDIELYREAQKPFEAALDDKSDMYRG